MRFVSWNVNGLRACVSKGNFYEAFKELDELRKQIESTPMQFKDYDFKVSMTYGLEEFNPRLGIEATINHADKKLYEGKTGGRNRVVM